MSRIWCAARSSLFTMVDGQSQALGCCCLLATETQYSLCSHVRGQHRGMKASTSESWTPAMKDDPAALPQSYMSKI